MELRAGSTRDCRTLRHDPVASMRHRERRRGQRKLWSMTLVGLTHDTSFVLLMKRVLFLLSNALIAVRGYAQDASFDFVIDGSKYELSDVRVGSLSERSAPTKGMGVEQPENRTPYRVMDSNPHVRTHDTRTIMVHLLRNTASHCDSFAALESWCHLFHDGIFEE